MMANTNKPIATAGSGMKWVGRAIRRFEDPTLVRGRGRFTGDLPATHFVRFVRSPVAAGRILKITGAADPADAAQIQLSPDRAANPGE